MDGTSLDRAGTSQCSAEQMILQESNSEYNEGPTTKLRLALESTEKCTQPEWNTDLDAGANADAKEEMMFVTTNPLSELVWSPHKGLSLKCADCSLDERKTFLCGMGLSNMVFSPPQSITAGQTNAAGPADEGNLKSSQMICRLDCQISDGVTLIVPPSSTRSVMPVCQTTDHEHNLGSGGDMKDLTSRMEQPLFNVNHEDDHSEKIEKRNCGPDDIQSTNISGTGRKMTSNNPEKASIPGPENWRTSDSSSIQVNEDKLDLAQVNPEFRDFEKGTSSDPFEGNREVGCRNSHTAGMDGESGSEASTSRQCKHPVTPIRISASLDHAQEELTSAIKEEGINKITAESSNFLLEKWSSVSGNDLEPLKRESASVEVGITSNPANEVRQSHSQNEGILPENGLALVQVSPNNSKIPLNRIEANEKVLSNAEFNGGILKDEDGSHESVESCNSTGLSLARKRPWNYDQQLVIANKKMKQSQENPHCVSVQRHGSSFMNWISNMMKGSSKSDLDVTTSSDLLMKPSPHEHEGRDQHFMLQEKIQQSGCTSTGFETIFKALYRPSTNVLDTEILKTDHQAGEGSNLLELANKACDNSSIPVTGGEENDKLCDFSTKNQLTYGDGEGPSSLPNIPSANICVVQEDHKTSTAKNNDLLNIACDLGKGRQISSNSSLRNGSDSPSKEKETCKLGFSDPNKSLNSVTNRSRPPGSLWITRFSPKVSGLMINSSQCEQNVGAAVEGSTDCIKILSPSQNCVLSVKDQNSCEDCQNPSTEDHVDVANKKAQNRLNSTAGSFGSIRFKGHIHQKLKSKVNTIQPSQRFKNLEAMASVFARKLDALRHIIPLEVDGIVSHATTTCIFCGIRGHKLQECSEISESEVEALLKKIDSYDGAQESSCFCIRCFQLNHWAIACPNISSRKRSHSDGGSSLLDFRNFGKILQAPRRDNLTNNDGRNLSDKMGFGCPVSLTVCDGKKSRVHTEVTDGSNVNKKVNDTKILNGSYLNSKMTKKNILWNDFCEGTSVKNTSRDLIHNEKQTKTSSSTENESKEIQITDIGNFVNMQIPAIPRGTFEAVKQLRLSRTDILKWMNSQVSHFPLEGFFLRLRLRKLEGGSGYYVARIIGILREKSSGSSKVPLAVMIGGFKCVVESRFISNHDFIEDELIAWWCATVKNGGNLPSEEDLEIKLKERKKFGF